MALKQYTVTMTGSNVRAVTSVTPVCFLRLENEAGNDDVKYGTGSLSATDYAGAVVDQQAGADNAVTLGPTPSSNMNLDEFYFLGTNSQKLHITAITQ